MQVYDLVDDKIGKYKRHKGDSSQANVEHSSARRRCRRIIDKEEDVD
jgi:hypothetical protein